MTLSKKLGAIGECMLELTQSNHLTENMHAIDASIGFGGDTLNTAIYASRLGVSSYYFTALGEDQYSNWLLNAWQREGLNTQYVIQCAGKLPGIYAIELDDRGERTFHYWRKESAASQYIRQVGAKVLFAQLQQMDVIYLSGISLGILDDAQKDILLEIVARLSNAGKIIAFDGNYRPRNWNNQGKAQQYFERILHYVNWYLPTLDDETLLFGSESIADVVAHYASYNIDELVIKDGENGCYIVTSNGKHKVQNVPIPAVVRPTDTTAAGDSFNAGYIAARMQGAAPIKASLEGHSLAAKVIQHRGAILPKVG